MLALCEFFLRLRDKCQYSPLARDWLLVQGTLIKSLIPSSFSTALRYRFVYGLHGIRRGIRCQSSVQWTEMFGGRPTNYIGTDL